jgi:hypothetical protein
MKIPPLPLNSQRGMPSPRPRECGMATVLFIALLAIMMILVTAETRSLIQLRRELKLLEQHQIQRLDGPPTRTQANALTNAHVNALSQAIATTARP